MAKAKPDPAKDAKASKQSTLMGFFGKPKPGPPPPRPSSSLSAPAPPSSSPTSTTLRTPSSAAGSSPATRPGVAAGRGAGTGAGSQAKRQGSPLKSSFTLESDGELSPPPEEAAVITQAEVQVQKTTLGVSAANSLELQAEEDVEMAPADGSPIVLGRRTKRKVIYAESEDSDADSDPAPAKTNGKPNGAGRKPRKSLKADSDSDDDFVFDEADEAAFAAAAEEFEASVMGSPTPSVASFASASPAPRTKKPIKKQSSFTAPKQVKKSIPLSSPGAGPSVGGARPGPRPLSAAGAEDESSRRSAGASASDSFLLTAAERRKIEARDEKREGEEIFSFLRDVRDAAGRRPDDPEYDKRTIFIPNKVFESLKPFEKQFWSIKRDHYDTVLFFQKGKFYELYEDDAMIGHQEFDLKLTDRVRMKMVGVPEQSFEMWAAKFLAAGYKVGKVEQCETAIGAEMRGKAEGKGPSNAKEDKIVRRELAQVFTNGTIVDSTYLTTDEANHCVAIKEMATSSSTSAFGVCVMDASTGEFSLSAFDDDVCRTRLETMFRQIRPKEILHAKGNLSVATNRLLRIILPQNTRWESFKDVNEFYSADQTIRELGEIFDTESDTPSEKPPLPDAIAGMLDKPLALEALGGMLFYIKSLHLDKDLVSQRNFNIYDPIREGKNLVLDGQTLGHMEVLVNNEGGSEGTLLELLQRCQTPFGKRLFRIWLTSPLRDVEAINARLDAVDDLMSHPDFVGQFTQLVKGLPDLERLVSRIHAGNIKQSDFLKVMESYRKLQAGIDMLGNLAESFEGNSVSGLLRGAPDMHQHLKHIGSLYSVETTEKTIAIMPTEGADEECDEANAEVARVEAVLEGLLQDAKRLLKAKDLKYWHSAQGGKEIFQIQVPAGVKVPRDWTKVGSTKAFNRYVTPDTLPVIREIQEARETQSTAKKGFFRHLLGEFDKERTLWLNTIRVFAELDCLVSLSKASAMMDEPKCRPTFVESDSAFVDFIELRHASMSLRTDNFIPNDVALGGTSTAGNESKSHPRQVLLTGPNMAGKSTLLRMTAAGIIMAQLGCYVPAREARLSPVDKIQTRMGAYDNMFASASTFKVELDECSKILREAGPRSFVILDELGRGTSTYDGMAIAGAVLHHLATHTLPLGFFATHYGSLTDDFAYHPNVRRMHMQTHVDDAERRVVFLYKLIPGVAESSHGTHVAAMAGVPLDVVSRAEQVSQEFFEAFKEKLSLRRQSKLPLVAQADFAWLIKLAMGQVGGGDGKAVASVGQQMEVLRRVIGGYDGK